mmetsp:Transcript_50407/g.133938  ORF Transcript_50407/g.133938 Transcript_50407/m.133938 type:complete len:731 (-) Transcript_50407:310-2502(-)
MPEQDKNVFLALCEGRAGRVCGTLQGSLADATATCEIGTENCDYFEALACRRWASGSLDGLEGRTEMRPLLTPVAAQRRPRKSLWGASALATIAVSQSRRATRRTFSKLTLRGVLVDGGCGSPRKRQLRGLSDEPKTRRRLGPEPHRTPCTGPPLEVVDLDCQVVGGRCPESRPPSISVPTIEVVDLERQVDGTRRTEHCHLPHCDPPLQVVAVEYLTMKLRSPALRRTVCSSPLRLRHLASRESSPKPCQTPSSSAPPEVVDVDCEDLMLSRIQDSGGPTGAGVDVRGGAHEARLAEGTLQDPSAPSKRVMQTKRPPNLSERGQRRRRRWHAMHAPAFCRGSSVARLTPCRERQLPWEETLPRGLPRMPTLQTAAEFPGLPVFWEFVAQALLGELSADPICHTFELGGTIDALGDVAFVRDEITASFLLHDDLESVVWHCLLFSWLGAGGPDQTTYRWLREENLARPFDRTTLDVVSEIYRRVRVRVQERGLCAVFSGDSRSVLFRLQPSQDGVLHGWFRSVPDIVAALRGGVTPETLEQVLRRVGCIGVLTAKEIFVHLSYACPRVADTTRHVPVGGGALAGAALVLSYRPGLRGSDEVRCGARQAGGALRGGGQVPGQGPRSLRTSEPKQMRSDVWGRRATLAIADLLNWAMANVPNLAGACRHYQRSAKHRLDPVRNQRVRRDQLLDIADVEVMLCFFKNYCKLKQRCGQGPPATCPRGWTRRCVS